MVKKILTLWLIVFMCLFQAQSAFSEGDALPIGSSFKKLINSSLFNFKLRLGPPSILTGPTATTGDFSQVYVPNGSGGFWVYGANQSPWSLTSPSLTSFFGDWESDSINGCGTPQTSCARNQTTGYNFIINPNNTVSPAVTRPTNTNYSNWNTTSLIGSINSPAPGGLATDQCGAWPIAYFKIGTTLYLYVHNEGPCDYLDPLGTFQLQLGATAAAGQAVLTVSSNNSSGTSVGGATGIVAGMKQWTGTYPNGISGSVSSVTSTTVTMSSNLTADVPIGAVLTFDQLGFTVMSQSLYYSTDGSGSPTSWAPVTSSSSPGTIVSSLFPYEPGQLQGFGDGSPTVDSDGFVYAHLTSYCATASCDYRNAVMRAPQSNLAPGNWNFYRDGSWSTPALNNQFNSIDRIPAAYTIPYVGSYTAIIPGTKGNPRLPSMTIASDGKDHAYWKSYPGQNIAGVGLSISLDHINYYTYPAPLIVYEKSIFVGRPDQSDLYLYTIPRNDVDGGTVLNPSHWNQTGIYVPPNGSLNDRFSVSYAVTKTSLTPEQIVGGVPQIAQALQTWNNPNSNSTSTPWGLHYRTTTVNPYASSIISGGSADGNVEPGWNLVNGPIGYILTACPNSTSKLNDCDSVGQTTANNIEECWSGSVTDDYQLHVNTNGINGSCPSGWFHLRKAGYLYKNQPASLINAVNPIYSCLTVQSGITSHFSSVDRGCNGKTFISFLGWALTN